MSNAGKFFRKGQTVLVSHYQGQDTDTESKVLIGTEEAEMIGVVSLTDSTYAGMMYVRPFNSEDVIAVHIKNIEAV